ncbi:MAG TPA: methyl-accepting chemotaxis protein, partial [Rheinheimera sp.]|nr:methyl-accepting chemotaxis protein [Rheinheimera sp.]
IDDLDSKIASLNADTQSELRAGTLRTLLIAALVVVAMVALGLMLASTIVKPLQRAVSAMQDVASGDGDLTRRLDADQGHELGALAIAFNNFAAKVAELVNNVRGSVATLSQSASELSTLMQQAERGVQQQHEESDQVATAMTEMSTTAQDVAGSASNAAHAANDAEQQVNRAATTLDAAIGVINGLEQQVNAGVEVISRVGNESQSIGGVIEVIRGIAEQTNLLALNAAIEAARAGDQGRGFAVVADEVRTLAARTASSTEEINQMIGRLQGGANEAVGAIGQIKQHSQHTVQEAEKVDRALREIQTAVATINDMNNQIASAAEEQTTVAETINQNIHQIVIIAQDTANGTSRAATISRQLDQLASELDTIVGRYRT